MADLKTTQDRRERFVAWLHMPGEDRYSVRAWATAEDACDDVEVLLRENAKLRHHYDAAAPEHNLLALLDLYEGRRLEAEAEVGRLRAEIESWRAGVKVAQGILDALEALGEP